MNATVITMVSCAGCMTAWACWDLRFHADIKHRRTAAAMCAAAWLLMLAAVHHQMDETQRLIAVRAAKPISEYVTVVSTQSVSTKNGHQVTWEKFSAGSPRTSRPVLRTTERIGSLVDAVGRTLDSDSRANRSPDRL